MARKPTSTNSQNQIVLRRFCVLNDTLHRIGMRWKMQVLYQIHHGATGFGALKHELSEITDQVLAKRLDELVAERLIVRSGTSRRTVYTVTSRGLALLEIMQSLCAWEASDEPEVLATRGPRLVALTSE